MCDIATHFDLSLLTIFTLKLFGRKLEPINHIIDLTITSQLKYRGILEETRLFFRLNLLVSHSFSKHFSSIFFSDSISVLTTCGLILLAIVLWMTNIFYEFAIGIRLLLLQLLFDFLTIFLLKVNLETFFLAIFSLFEILSGCGNLRVLDIGALSQITWRYIANYFFAIDIAIICLQKFRSLIFI